MRLPDDDLLIGIPPLVAAVASRATSSTPTRPSLDLTAGRLDARRDTLDHWGAALARGDEAEVNRLVRQSRVDRIWGAACGELGTMLG